MTIQYIDIHSHLNLDSFSDDADRVAEDLARKEIATITVGTSLEDSRKAVALAERHGNLFACVGVHPVEGDRCLVDFDELRTLAFSHNVVAIGETGLDYFHEQDASAIDKQRDLFLAHVALAIELDKPLMLHIRPTAKTTDAYDDMLVMLSELKQTHQDRLRGNVHFFVGTPEQALAFNALGFTISVTGVITFTRDYDEIIRVVPLAMLHAETDAPFVTPIPHRGERNNPAHVRYVYETIAAIRQEPIEHVRTQLIANARRLFGID